MHNNKGIILGLTILFIIGSALCVNAAIVTWTHEGVDNLASNTDNWSGYALPQNEDDVFFNGTSTDDGSWDIDVTPVSLRLDSGYSGTVTLNSDLTINGNMAILDGIMILNNNLQITGTALQPPVWNASLISTFGRPSYNTVGELNYPSGVTVDNNGDVYVCTDLNSSINKFDAQGNFISKWAMGDCFGLEADSGNNIYVAARFEYKVYKYDSSGNVLAEWGSYCNILNGNSCVDPDGPEGPLESGDGQFNSLNDVAVNNTLGLVYVSDTRNLRVQVFDTQGNFLFKWGSAGSGDGQFGTPRGPLGIAVDEYSGEVYVTDADGRRVQKFDQDGNYLLQWGSSGNAEDQFYWPRSAEVDSNGNVYIVDGDNERIQIFDPFGNLVMVIKGEPYVFVPSCSPHLSHTDCTAIHNIADGPFHPRDVAVDSLDGSIYVAATYAQRIDKFDSSGNFLLTWGWWEKDNGVFNNPGGMAIDVFRGYIYVADTFNHIIQKFDLDGNFLTSWGYSGRVSTIWDGGDGSFDYPVNITTDDMGNVYVINPSSYYPGDPIVRLIQKFDQNGTFLGGWNYNDPNENIHLHNLKGIAYNPFNGCIYVINARDNVIQCFDTSGNYQFEFGGSGGAAGEFNYPSKIAVDRNTGDIYVIDLGNARIQKLSGNGSYLTHWGAYGTGDGAFRLDEYSGIHVDDNGYVYVADSRNNRIEVFDSNGDYFVQLYVGGRPSGIVVDTNGNVYVADRVNDKVDKYTPVP